MARMEEADELLVARARRGDTAAFGLLVERYQDALFNGICRMVRRREDAEDLAQEVFVKAFSGIAGFRGQCSFYTWLYSIAFNTVISHRRRASSALHHNPETLSEVFGEEGNPYEVEDDAERPDATMERHELHRRLEAAVASLDEEHRAVIVLRDVEGFGYREIGQVLGCPTGTVKSRLHRARQALREQLKDLLE